MVRSARIQSAANMYHAVARGVSRRIIYEDDKDRTQFLDSLAELAREHDAKVHAWCLMSNHYHLLLEIDFERLPIMMKALNSVHALRFNIRHDRVGHLFQGRFKSEPVDTDERFLTVLRYIHQNPVKAGLVETCDYPWSSYRAYVGMEPPRFEETALALELLGGADGLATFHEKVDFKAVCCDVGSGRKTVEDDEALRVARAVLGDVAVESVCGLDKASRNESIRALKDARLSIRQIERLTGISRGIVASA